MAKQEKEKKSIGATPEMVTVNDGKSSRTMPKKAWDLMQTTEDGTKSGWQEGDGGFDKSDIAELNTVERAKQVEEENLRAQYKSITGKDAGTASIDTLKRTIDEHIATTLDPKADILNSTDQRTAENVTRVNVNPQPQQGNVENESEDENENAEGLQEQENGEKTPKKGRKKTDKE